MSCFVLVSLAVFAATIVLVIVGVVAACCVLAGHQASAEELIERIRSGGPK